MRIQAQQNVHTSVAAQAKYKTQHVVAQQAGLDAASLVAKGGFQAQAQLPVVGAQAPGPLVIQKQPGNEPAQPNWMGLADWLLNPFKVTFAAGTLGGAVGQAAAGFVAGVVGWFGSMMKGPEPQPALSAPVSMKRLPDAAATERLGQVFDELDEDRDGRLTGGELTQNTLFAFNPACESGKTRAQFIEEAFALECRDGVTLSPEEARACSPRGRIAALMQEVWGTPELFNETSFKWWKGQLKLVNGNYDRLQEKMVDYKKSIERA